MYSNCSHVPHIWRVNPPFIIHLSDRKHINQEAPLSPHIDAAGARAGDAAANEGAEELPRGDSERAGSNFLKGAKFFYCVESHLT